MIWGLRCDDSVGVAPVVLFEQRHLGHLGLWKVERVMYKIPSLVEELLALVNGEAPAATPFFCTAFYGCDGIMSRGLGRIPR